MGIVGNNCEEKKLGYKCEEKISKIDWITEDLWAVFNHSQRSKPESMIPEVNC